MAKLQAGEHLVPLNGNLDWHDRRGDGGETLIDSGKIVGYIDWENHWVVVIGDGVEDRIRENIEKVGIAIKH